MGHNVTVCVGVGGICHDCNDCGGGIKGAESKLIALCLHLAYIICKNVKKNNRKSKRSEMFSKELKLIVKEVK